MNEPVPPMNAMDAVEGEKDGALVRLAQGGDRDAFAELYQRYARVVHGIMLARLPSAEVDDQVQEVFIAALRKLGSLRDAQAFGGWLCAIARNRAADFHRSAVSTEELTDTEESASNSAENAEAGEALRAIRSLPETYRETLMLRLVEGLTGPEIAARTGLTHGSVRVNLHRGMEMLRVVLGRKLPS
jgi:RNA polymerase sigma-70 factor (ECF subfamily)